MKSGHRHELKTNELAEWLSNFPQWAKKNRTTIICVSVLIVVVAGLYFYRRYQKKVVLPREQLDFTGLVAKLPASKMEILQVQSQGNDYSFILLQPANNLQAIARNTKNDQMAALALIKRAEILRTELHYRPGTVSKQDVINQINRAKASYTEAIERVPEDDSSALGPQKSPSNPSLIAAAKLGLGLCEEEIGNFAEAEQIYRDITENPSFEGTVAAAQAKQRLNTMADYQQKVVFKQSPIKSVAEPAPTKTELTQPQFQLNPAEGSQTPNDAFGGPDINSPNQ